MCLEPIYSASLSVFCACSALLCSALQVSTSANRLSNTSAKSSPATRSTSQTLALSDQLLKSPQHTTRDLFVCFFSLLSSGRSFEGHLACIPFNIRYSNERRVFNEFSTSSYYGRDIVHHRGFEARRGIHLWAKHQPGLHLTLSTRCYAHFQHYRPFPSCCSDLCQGKLSQAKF
jgi:hypothetical protein